MSSETIRFEVEPVIFDIDTNSNDDYGFFIDIENYDIEIENKSDDNKGPNDDKVPNDNKRPNDLLISNKDLPIDNDIVSINIHCIIYETVIILLNLFNT